MPQNHIDRKSQKKMPRKFSKVICSIIALVAVAPYMGLQLYDMLTGGVSIWLAYCFPNALSVILGVWIILLFIEVAFRISSLRRNWCPWFSIIGFCFLYLYIFDYSDKVARPLVLLNPKFCYVNQITRWTIDSDIIKQDDKLSYILVLRGPGNNKHYKFTGGWLNWTGDEPNAGMSTFDLDSMRIGYFYEEEALTLENFSLRIKNTNLSDTTKQMLTEEIWNVLQQAKYGNPISAEHGTIEPLEVVAEDYAEGVVWLPILIITFQIMGHLTLNNKNRNDFKKENELISES